MNNLARYALAPLDAVAAVLAVPLGEWVQARHPQAPEQAQAAAQAAVNHLYEEQAA